MSSIKTGRHPVLAFCKAEQLDFTTFQQNLHTYSETSSRIILPQIPTMADTLYYVYMKWISTNADQSANEGRTLMTFKSR
jgi:hypothetical protein